MLPPLAHQPLVLSLACDLRLALLRHHSCMQQGRIAFLSSRAAERTLATTDDR